MAASLHQCDPPIWVSTPLGEGHAALSALWDIDQRCRALLKHGEPTPEEAQLAEEIRGMIDGELLEA